MHIKYVSPAGWDFDRQIATPLKVSSRGLIGQDRQDFLKTASCAFIPQLPNLKFAADEYPMHLIAMGASEMWGNNRNGDGFKSAACRDRHSTFVKLAQFFRNHANKPERGHPSYGRVVASAWNPDMARIELLCALNAEKSAADRNKGLIADTEVQKLASGKDVPVSMACHVPNDVCSWCKHAAANRDEYCTASTCGAGGCKDNLARLVKVGNDLHRLHVDNPEPTWFDISSVWRPADHTAYGAKLDYLTKAAADNGVVDVQTTLRATKEASAPLSVVLYQNGVCGSLTEKLAAQLRLGYALAVVERQEQQANAPAAAYASLLAPPLPIEKFAKYNTPACSQQLAALADAKVVLSLRDFARLTNREEHLKSASAMLPCVYSVLSETEVLTRRMEKGGHDLLTQLPGAAARSLAASLVGGYSFNKAAASDREILASLRGQTAVRLERKAASEFCKLAEDATAGTMLVQDYAVYKLAALCRIAEFDSDFPLTVRSSVRQNQIAQGFN